MKAFHNDPAVKRKYLGRVRAHQKADEIIKGTYWENGKGCAVGCTVHSANHSAYETELGIPRILARLEDGIFENLPNELARTWPSRFLAAIKPGADLTHIWAEFAVWMLRDDQYGVLQFARTDDQRDAVNSVADLYDLQLSGAIVDVQDFMEARSAANAAASATAYAAYAAAYAAYAYAAYAAAAAAAYADANAAYAGERTEWRIAQSEKLIELLKAAK